MKRCQDVGNRRACTKTDRGEVLSLFTVNATTATLKKLFTRAKAWGVRFEHEPEWKRFWLKQPPEPARGRSEPRLTFIAATQKIWVLGCGGEMPTIFISYRRDDTQVIVGRISDWLDRHYGQQAVFVDIESIPLGFDFREKIRSAIQRSDIVLAVIGPHWLALQKETGKPRIADEMDWVRIELETALANTIPVIPVLVEHARLPKPDELPEPLRDLPFRAATVLDTGVDFRLHMERLISAMDRFLGAEATRWEPDRSQTTEKVAEGGSRDTAYDDFLDIMKRFKTLSVGALGIGTAAPFFAYVGGIAPPWPPGMMLITALTELVCLIVVFQFLRTKGRKLVNRVIAALTLSLSLASLA